FTFNKESKTTNKLKYENPITANRLNIKQMYQF
ncbi:MAG: hypothetical protein RLZZ493_721, partial [Bacteroidota bacterium]